MAQSFETVLLIQHEGRPGRKAVEDRYYKLQDASNPKKWTEVEQHLPFDQVFQSGGCMDMTVNFPYDTEPCDPEQGSACPRCWFPEGLVMENSKITW